jgi:hypothetical protein
VAITIAFETYLSILSRNAAESDRCFLSPVQSVESVSQINHGTGTEIPLIVAGIGVYQFLPKAERPESFIQVLRLMSL